MDFALGQTFDFKFTTRAFATGIPTTLAGTPVVEIYEDNSLTQITAAETLTVDFDTVTGLNNLRVVATSGNGFEAGKSYAAVISTGTVGGVSVVGEVILNFTVSRLNVASWNAVSLATTNPLPNAAADAAGGLPISDAGGLDLDTKLANTNEITAARMGALTDWIDGGRLDLILDAILVDTGTTLDGKLDTIDGIVDAILVDTGTTIPGTIATIDTVVDAIKVVTDQLVAAQTEPTGVPAANETPLVKLGYLFMALRNKVTITATKKQFFDDGGAAEWEKDVSDNGTTYTETEANAI